MSEESTLFPKLNEAVEDPDPEITQIESLCTNCFSNGVTRLLLTMIPFYKEVVIMSFTCNECGYQNNEIQPGGKVAEQGIRIQCQVTTTEDLNRKVVKSDFSSVRIEELDFEIPSRSQKGEVTTIEGIFDRVVRGLEQDQVLRRIEHPEAAAQIDEFIEKLNKYKELQAGPFTIIIEDASGNSFIENLVAPSADPKMKISHFVRTKEQNEMLGFYENVPGAAAADDESTEKAKKTDSENNESVLKMAPEGAFPYENFEKNEVLQFQTNCPDCNALCETNMKVTSIPHFKDVVIMATLCESCGYRTNEVKSGSGIEEKGVRIEVKIKTKEDFSRDILKSEFCSLKIPELECEIGSHALGGKFTTCEGMLVAVKEQLAEQSGMFFDSQNEEQKTRMNAFFDKLDKVLRNEMEVTLILDDPTGNSYIQSLFDDVKDDPGLRIFRYHRSHEQNEDLGLNDMKTENYEEQQQS